MRKPRIDGQETRLRIGEMIIVQGVQKVQPGQTVKTTTAPREQEK